MNKSIRLIRIIVSIAFLCHLSSSILFAQALHLTNQSGVEYKVKPALPQRLSGVKQIYFFYPNSSAQNDKYAYQNFKVYLQRLGLTVIDRALAYDRIDASQGSIIAYNLCCKGGVTQYMEGVNVVCVVMNIFHAYSQYSSDRMVTSFTFYDPINDYTWDYKIEPDNKAEKYIRQCQNTICSSYFYNSKNAYHPSYITSNYTKYVLRSFIDKGEYTAIEGIYEGDDYTLGVKKGTDGKYYLLYHGSKKEAKEWSDGYVKAVLRESSTPGVYRATWYGRYFQILDFKIIFENGVFTTYDEDNDKALYIKMYPTNKMESEKSMTPSEWSGTGFALKDGYIVTNYHVVDGAKSILIYGVNGNMSISYSAKVVASDRTNDLAIIQITDSRFTGFGPIPYAIKNQMVDVGEDVWVLGYPLTQVLGNEIKLTNGIVSSKSGYQGDVATYQISAPVQPGNSGGPLFDSMGNVVGIVNAGVPGADNVGYAIKTSYLKNLADSYSLSAMLPLTSSISSLVLKEQVKRVSNYVFLLICSSKTGSYSSTSSYTSSSSSRSSTTSGNGISISRTYLYLSVGETFSLSASNYGTSLRWESDDTNVATVSSTGLVTAVQPGNTSIWALGANEAKRCEVVVRANANSSSSTSYTGKTGVPSSSYTSSGNKPQMVDLGLSVKWADRNVGASSSYEIGEFYSWGETTPKNEFTRESYKWFKDDQYSNPGGLSDIGGSSYDPASSSFGSSWRMPTEAEIEELINKCTWTWTTTNGVEGYKVTGQNGNSIFLPSNGTRTSDNTPIGSYWSSEGSPYAPYYSYNLNFEKGSKSCTDDLRESFGSIRPVSGSKTLPKTSHKKADEALSTANRLYSQGDYQGAYTSVCNSINIKPSSAAHFLRGFLASYVANDNAAAKESLLYCINSGYRIFESRELYAHVLMDNGEYKEAIQQLDLFLNDYPTKDYNYLEAWYNKIHCYTEQKDWSKTISEYQQLLEYEGKVDFDYGTVYNNIAWAYLNLNQVNKAVSPIQKAIKLNHNRGYIWDTYGEVQYKTGEFEQCISSMTNAIAIYKAEDKDDLDNSFLYRGLAKIKTGNIAGGYVDLEKAADLGNAQAEEELRKINAANIDFSNSGTFKHEVERDISSTYAGDDTKIIRIELSEESTILYLQYTNNKYETGGWYAIDPDAYIRDKSTGKKHLLLTAQNCAISPQHAPINKGETVTFALVFPALPEGAKMIDFVESEDSKWKFYNIVLR